MANKRTVPILAGLTLSWMVLTVLSLLDIFPHYPHSIAGWALLIALAPPVYLIAECIGSWIFSKEHGMRVSGTNFSILRIIVGTLVMAIVMAVVLWIANALMR